MKKWGVFALLLVVAAVVAVGVARDKKPLASDLDGRAMVVLDPVKLELTNWAEVFGNADHLEPCHLPALPHALSKLQGDMDDCGG